MDIEDPFERTVVMKLYSSLVYVRSLAEEIQSPRLDFKIPEDSVEYGLSSNLCDALVGINKSGKSSGIEINMSWASALELPSGIHDSIVFPSRIMPAVARLGRRLKADIQKNFEFRGEVYRLQRQRRDMTGQVTLVGNIDGQQKRIKVELNDLAYQKASQANQDRRLIFCKGELIKEGRTYTLSNPRRFSFLDDRENSSMNDEIVDQLTMEIEDS